MKIRLQGRRGSMGTSAQLAAASMAIGGARARDIARALDLTIPQVETLLNRPDTKEFILTVREQIKGETVSGILKANKHALDWLGQLAKAKEDPKGLQAVAGAIANMEKITASLTGEARPQVSVQNAVITQPTAEASAELKELLSKLTLKG